MWSPAGAPATATLKTVSPRLAFIAALDTDGRIFYSLTHANTDSDIIIMFVSNLCRKLDAELGEWKSNTVFLLDNATYHQTEECLRIY